MRISKPIRLVIIGSSLACSLLACSETAPATPEPMGATASDIKTDGTTLQRRMRESKELLRHASTSLASTTPTSAALSVIAQALDEVQQGIRYDATHVSDSEGHKLDDAANVAASDSIAACAEDSTTQTTCLLEAAEERLKSATTDKGRYRVEAMRTIEQALGMV